jgi:hypothetical protein
MRAWRVIQARASVDTHETVAVSVDSGPRLAYLMRLIAPDARIGAADTGDLAMNTGLHDSIRMATLCVLASLALLPALAHALAVTTTTPGKNANNIARDAAIVIDFDRAVNPATVTDANFWVWGRSRGKTAGTIAYSNGNQRLTFTPTTPFFPGEVVLVNMARAVSGADATQLPQGGFAFQYTTRAGVPGSFSFSIYQRRSVKTSSSATRLYGGAFPDLNNDGWIDYVSVNEVSGDLRTMLNMADGSGMLGPVLLPPRQIGLEASPNESVDFDRDGRIDMVTGNTSSDTVSIVLGNGDGTFDPQQSINVGDKPHGVAALDVDGDADLDVVTSVEGANYVGVMRNNGAGVFGTPTTFDSGASGEWPLAPGDMNNDGIMDIVVGAHSDGRIIVMLGDGNGGFARPPGTPSNGYEAGGSTWMIAVGDVNNDGNLDVSTVNGFSANGGILLGNGNGTLQPVTLYSGADVGDGLIATDFGDMDGDGDLDWVISSFSNKRWTLFLNNGSGAYTFSQHIPAAQAGSCASLYDVDNDGDLDMALADELEDEVRMVRNGMPFTDSFETL